MSLTRRLLSISHCLPRRQYSTKPRIFDPITTAADLSTTISLSSSANRPLLTLWTMSACKSCKTIAPLLHDLFSQASSATSTVPAELSYAEVEFDSPTFLSGGMADATGAESVLAKSTITSIPTLLAFSRRGVPMLADRLTDIKLMTDVKKVEEWVKKIDSKA